LTADRLARALIQATVDAEMRRRAADLGARIRAESGVATAVRWIEEAIQTSR
jgi:UDP:flavonoid glycosyltransferase YjiC (YdhE family)